MQNDTTPAFPLTKEIPLTQGKVALVDSDDYGELSKFKWAAARTDNTFYACRKGRVGTGEKRTVLMHRVIMNAPTGVEVDHQNGNGLDNRRRANLRLATPTQNKENRRLQTTKHNHGYKGIWRNGNRWAAEIKHDGRKFYIGLYPTKEMAALAYDYKARELFGEFANLNFPDRNEPMPDRGVDLPARSSRYKGVTFCSSRGSWQSTITVKGRKRCFIGRFKTEEAAAAAYDVKAKELLGDKATLNFA